MEDTLAIDIGGTFIKFGVVSPDYQLKSHYFIATHPFENVGDMFDDLCRRIRSLEGVGRIGVCAPGLVDLEGRVKNHASPRLRALFGANIKEEMERRTGLFTSAINDAKAAGLCELKLGNARGTKCSAFLIIGTGAGGCICLEDDVYGGADNFAGEFHFMVYPDEHTGEIVKTGCMTGTLGLIHMYNQRTSARHHAHYGKEITDRYLAGEPLAGEVVADWIHRIALHCLNIVVTINPEVLLIGGGISEADWFISSLKAEYERVSRLHFSGIDFVTTRLDRCQYRGSANLLGAALRVRMCQENQRMGRTDSAGAGP